MLSVNQVYNEPSTHPRKLKSGSSSGLGLKNATNSISRLVSGREIKKKQFKAIKKNVVKAKPKTETVSFSDEEWLDIENSCEYEYPEGSSSGLGLKNATNSISRLVPGREIKKKQFKAIKKNVVKAEPKTETVSFSDEEWLDIENSSDYEDDYEYLLPEEHRIPISALGCLFKMGSFIRSNYTIDDSNGIDDWMIENPIQTLELPSLNTSSNLYDDTHFSFEACTHLFEDI